MSIFCESEIWSKTRIIIKGRVKTKVFKVQFAISKSTKITFEKNEKNKDKLKKKFKVVSRKW